MPRSRSENQSRTRLGWHRRHDVDGVIVIWQTLVISSTFAVPRLVEEGAKTEDLKFGADQSGLLEDLRLKVNFNQVTSECDKRPINLSGAVQNNSLLPERSCLAAHPPQTRQDRINLNGNGQ